MDADQNHRKEDRLIPSEDTTKAINIKWRRKYQVKTCTRRRSKKTGALKSRPEDCGGTDTQCDYQKKHLQNGTKGSVPKSDEVERRSNNNLDLTLHEILDLLNFT